MHGCGACMSTMLDNTALLSDQFNIYQTLIRRNCNIDFCSHVGEPGNEARALQLAMEDWCSRTKAVRSLALSST